MESIIICVDDDINLLEGLRQEIMREIDNIAVEIAESGEEALELIQEIKEDNETIAIIITDQIMPTMKGHELLIKVHTLDVNIKKILLSGQTCPEDVKLAREQADLFYFLEKPWSNKHLTAVLRKALAEYHK